MLGLALPSSLLYSICQERGLWNCTAHHCPPQQALCPPELVYAPGACLLTCDSPRANHSCLAGSTDGCVCPPGTVLLVRLGRGPMGQPGALPIQGPSSAPLMSKTVFPPSTQDKHCVPPDLCPCRHNGQWYPPNATIQEDCNIWYAEFLSPVTLRPCDP